MATATRPKQTGSKADMDKDLQSLMELQEKLNMTSGLHQMVVQQMQRAHMTQRRSQLTLQELAELSADVPVYQQVGKAYLMAPIQQVKDDLKQEITGLDDELKRLNQQQQHTAKTLAATEKEVEELFKSNPELTRQLMPV